MTTTYTVTRDDIIKAALRGVGKLAQGAVPSTEDFLNCAQALNLLVKNWMGKGATLWKIQELTLPLVASVVRYPIGPSAGYVYLISVTAGGSGYSSAPAVIFSAPPVGTVATGTAMVSGGAVTAITITNPGSGYVVAPAISIGGPGAGAAATAYIAGLTADRPLRVLDEGNFIRNTATNLDTSVHLLARGDYKNLGSKAPSGSYPNSIWYDPQISSSGPTVSNGQLYVYPPLATGVAAEMHLQCQVPYSDLVNSGDIPDFPQEWFLALKWNLMDEIGPEYRVEIAERERNENRARELREELLNFSQDEASAYFTYNARMR